jgi:hypothetical protein
MVINGQNHHVVTASPEIRDPETKVAEICCERGLVFCSSHNLFKLFPHKYEEYKVLRFSDGDCALVVDVWLHRVEEDASGLIFSGMGPVSGY